jgi:Fis family transcriptional regulator
MNKLDGANASSGFALPETGKRFSQSPQPSHETPSHETPAQESTLRSQVERSLQRYFKQLDNEPATDLHRLVMSEVEAPLLEAVMRYTGNNQSKASIMLGLNRGTLRTKLKLYGML